LALNPAIEIESPRLAGAVPEAADKVSQDCVLDAVQLNVPPPVFEILTFWDAGFEAPAVAEKLTLNEPTLNCGGRGALPTTSVTATVCVPALPPLIVTVSV
jgi:hypothetical protein